MSLQPETLFEFPCVFSIKAFGLAEPGFDALVAEIVRRHAPEVSEQAVRTRLSNGGKYLSVTVTIRATSRQQLDAIYQELTDNSRVLMSI